MELMVSMAIGTIILFVAVSLLERSGDGYERVGGSVASEREARALITQLTADLSTAIFHKDGVIEKSSRPWSADRLGFLSLQPADAQSDGGRIGDLCAVNYYIKDLTIGGRTVRCLMRGFRESSDAFKSLEAGSIPSLFIERSNIDGPVVFGVVSFEARPKERDSKGKWIDWVKNDKTGPQALDVKLVIARRALAGKLKQSGDWDGSGNAGKLLGDPAGADRNKDLEVYGGMLRFGNDNA